MKSLLICVVLLSLFLFDFGHSKSPLAPAFFIFGDSLVDSGNNNYIPTLARANYLPYGIDFGFPSGRFLGARTTFNGQISQFEMTIELQLRPFFQNPADLRNYLAKSIIGINIGSNDYINNYLMPERYSSSQIYKGEDYADLLIKTLSAQLSRLYNLGARKMMLAGSGPLGCIPSQLSLVSISNNNNNTNSGCVTKINDLVSMFNSRLKDLPNTLNTTLPGSFFVYQNVYDLFHDMVIYPSRYGLVIPNKACCGNGRYGGALTCLPMQQPCSDRRQYVFWDAFHPTEK